MSAITEATFSGYISSTHDALLVFECVRRGIMPKVTRRLRDNERHLIRSGHVFVFDERESGIKRWTDGLLWSPSRILYNFLVYRQIDTKLHIVKAQTNEQAKTASASASSARGSAPASVGSSAPSPTLPDPLALGVEQSNEPRRRVPSPPALPDARSAGDAAELERNLVGSLTNSYPFAKGGLCKKTISLQVEGSTQHLVSYYSLEDVRAGRLRTPASLPEVNALPISPVFLSKTSFRFPPTVIVGPHGVPRYSRDSGASDPGMRASDGASSGEATSGSEGRSAPSAPAAAPVAARWSALSNLGMSSSRNTSSPMVAQASQSSPDARQRRSSDAPLRTRRGGERFEPYPSAHAAAAPFSLEDAFYPMAPSTAMPWTSQDPPAAHDRAGASMSHATHVHSSLGAQSHLPASAPLPPSIPAASWQDFAASQAASHGPFAHQTTPFAGTVDQYGGLRHGADSHTAGDWDCSRPSTGTSSAHSSSSAAYMFDAVYPGSADLGAPGPPAPALHGLFALNAAPPGAGGAYLGSSPPRVGAPLHDRLAEGIAQHSAWTPPLSMAARLDSSASGAYAQAPEFGAPTAQFGASAARRMPSPPSLSSGVPAQRPADSGDSRQFQGGPQSAGDFHAVYLSRPPMPALDAAPSRFTSHQQ